MITRLFYHNVAHTAMKLCLLNVGNYYSRYYVYGEVMQRLQISVKIVCAYGVVCGGLVVLVYPLLHSQYL